MEYEGLNVTLNHSSSFLHVSQLLCCWLSLLLCLHCSPEESSDVRKVLLQATLQHDHQHYRGIEEV